MSANSSLIIPQNPKTVTSTHVGKFEVGYFWDYKIFSTAPHIILLTLSCSLARVRGRARFFSFSILFFLLSSLFFLLVLFFLFLLSLFFLSLSLLFWRSCIIALVVNFGHACNYIDFMVII